MRMAMTLNTDKFVRKIGLALAVMSFIWPSEALVREVTPDTQQLVTAIARIRTASSPSFSPDGKLIAYVSDESGVPNVWIVPSDGGAPHQVTKLTDPVSSVRWTPAGDSLALEVAPSGGSNVQVRIVRADGAGMKTVASSEKSQTALSGWTRDGCCLMLSSNSRDPARFDAYLLNTSSGETRTVGAVSNANVLVTDVSPDGKLAIVTKMADYPDSSVHLISLTKNTETLLSGRHEAPTSLFGGIGNVRWGKFAPDGRRIYLTSGDDRDLLAFAAIHLDSSGTAGRMQVLAARDDAEADIAALDPQGQRAALVWNVASVSELAFLQTATGKIISRPALPTSVITSVSFSPDGNRIAFVGSGAAEPTGIYIMEVPSGVTRRLTQSRHDGVDPDELVRPTLVRYQGYQGLEMSGWLYQPRTVKGPGPVVFYYHGGPAAQTRPTMDGTLYGTIQALIRHGITVFAPNVRGSSGFGQRFEKLDDGPLRVNAVRDIKATADYFVERGIADRKRLGIMGTSNGGFMVLAALTEFPDTFAAGADIFGFSDFLAWFKNTQPWNALESKAEYGDPVRDAEMLKSLSPIHKLDRIKSPLIVLHGAHDGHVAVAEANEIVEGLKRRNVPVRYVLFQDEGHGFRKTSNRVHSTVSIVEFFDDYLSGR